MKQNEEEKVNYTSKCNFKSHINSEMVHFCLGWYKLQEQHDSLSLEHVNALTCSQCMCVRDFSACQGSVMEEKWLIKELLLLQYHVAPLQSHSVRDIYQAGSSLPGVLGSCTRVAASCEVIDRAPSIAYRAINPSHWFPWDIFAQTFAQMQKCMQKYESICVLIVSCNHVSFDDCSPQEPQV